VRIALDTTALYDARTGVGRFTAAVLERLARRPDVDVTAYAVTWRGRDDLRTLVPAGVDVGRGPMAARPLRELWRRVDWPPIEWWTGPADVVHGPNFVVPPARRAARVVTVHDLTPVRFPELCTRDTLQYPALIDRAVRSGAWVHAVSASVAAEVIEAFPVDPDRVVVVANGVDAVAGGDPAAGRQLAGGDRYVLAVGTVEPRKDLPLLVRAFDAVAAADPAVRLVIAGPDGWGAAALAGAISDAHHRDQVVRLGWVTDDQRADLLAGAAILAYPSRYEGFGLPPLEAMAAGLPVVTTSVGALPEVLGDAAVLVPPNDERALAAAIAAVLDDDGRRAELTARGRARAAAYDWDRTVDGLVDLYRRVVS
jgi:glycosyltransferase involved in cell wall biosynthesis